MHLNAKISQFCTWGSQPLQGNGGRAAGSGSQLTPKVKGGAQSYIPHPNNP